MRGVVSLGIVLAIGLAALPASGAAPRVAAATYQPPPLPELDAAQTRGRDFAARRCGGCHNVGLDDGPPYEGPAFRVLAVRYGPAALERRFSEVSAHGFERMPPTSFTRAEAADLAAYFESLQPAR